MANELIPEEYEAIEHEINEYKQILRQTQADIEAYNDGWKTDEELAEALRLRDDCYENISRLNAQLEIAELVKSGDAMPERVTIAEGGLLDIAELASNNEVSIDDLETAVIELAEMIGGN